MYEEDLKKIQRISEIAKRNCRKYCRRTANVFYRLEKLHKILNPNAHSTAVVLY